MIELKYQAITRLKYADDMWRYVTCIREQPQDLVTNTKNKLARLS